ncbi:Nucleoside-diphosphate-sugar epimerase [Glycomyces sambucus]|uniref:Nucleoside-diphosphate-sugar epimerase n=1 Tax=Glycomyces sambucus TaxID=380244 RepID=A0A1G9CL36_9ACTN|nr:sugar nucleotide-binding protein [Glycomyces sambucus]SDK52164.1 Nucleoside-diphosphate-sugar epimerase [Glycomyces sambucus]
MNGSSVLLFGCGKVGVRLGGALIASGHRVFAVRRRIEALPEAFTGIALDYREPFAAALPEVDAMVVTLTPDRAERDSPDLTTPLHRLAAALPVRPRRVVLVSSTGVFSGDPGIRPLTEDDAPRPRNARSQALLDSEDEARHLFDAVVVRPAGIYGPGREHLLRQVARGAVIDRERRTNRVHETDLVRALHELVRSPEPPRTLHAVDGRPASLGEVTDHIARRLGVPAPPASDAGPSGHVVSGERFASFMGTLAYPDYRSGYDEIIASGGVERWR